MSPQLAAKLKASLDETPQIFTCEQGSDEWHACRMGIPTASEFATVMRAKGKAADGSSKTRTTYMLKLAGEIITGKPADNYTNENFDRGHVLEPEAREIYAIKKDCWPTQVGFIRRGMAGCSPDSLVGNDGLLEIKTAFAHIQLGHLIRDEFPAEHRAQCQGALWITGREWIDVAIYWPGCPLFIKRATRDEKYIGELAVSVEQFNIELMETVEKIRRMQ
jgi:hypothetical protein